MGSKLRYGTPAALGAAVAFSCAFVLFNQPVPSRNRVYGMFELLAASTSLIGLIVALFALHKASQGHRIYLFKERFAIFCDAEHFINVWRSEQKLDPDALGRLISAWSRSHFLCRPEVTEYLKALWLEGLNASQNRRIMLGEEQGSFHEAETSYRSSLARLTDSATLRQVFGPDLSHGG